MPRSGGDVRIHLGTGMFWFWEGAWWNYLEALAPALLRIDGIQVLCAPVLGHPPLPPVAVIRALPPNVNVTLHPSFSDPASIDYTPEAGRAFERMNAWIAETGVRDVVVHSNHFARQQQDLDAFRAHMPGVRVLVENVGALSAFGHAPADVAAVLELDGSLGFVLDIAHVSEVDPSFRDVQTWLDDPILGQRLCMMHVSASGIALPGLHSLCPPEIGQADHLPAFLNPSSPAPETRGRLSAHPLVTEGCLPVGAGGFDWQDREIEYLTHWAA